MRFSVGTNALQFGFSFIQPGLELRVALGLKTLLPGFVRILTTCNQSGMNI